MKARLRQSNILEDTKLENDHFLLRYLRFNKLNVDKAEKSIEYYNSYNEQINLDSLFAKKFSKEFTESYKLYLGGGDYQNRPGNKHTMYCILQS